MAARFLIICNRLSAFIKDELTVPEAVELDDVLLLDELGADFIAIGFTVELPDLKRLPLLPLIRLGESERLRNVTGLSRLDPDLGRLADVAFLLLFTFLLQVEHNQTSRGSFASASLMLGL